MRSLSGFLFFTVGALAALGTVVWGLALAIPLVRELAGTAGVVAAVVLFPVTLAVTPWYAALAHGAWMLLGVAYGGGLVALAFLGAGVTTLVQHLNMNTSPGNPRRVLPFLRLRRSR